MCDKLQECGQPSSLEWNKETWKMQWMRKKMWKRKGIFAGRHLGNWTNKFCLDVINSIQALKSVQCLTGILRGLAVQWAGSWFDFFLFFSKWNWSHNFSYTVLRLNLCLCSWEMQIRLRRRTRGQNCTKLNPRQLEYPLSPHLPPSTGPHLLWLPPTLQAASRPGRGMDGNTVRLKWSKNKEWRVRAAGWRERLWGPMGLEGCSVRAQEDLVSVHLPGRQKPASRAQKWHAHAHHWDGGGLTGGLCSDLNGKAERLEANDIGGIIFNCSQQSNHKNSFPVHIKVYEFYSCNMYMPIFEAPLLQKETEVGL